MKSESERLADGDYTAEDWRRNDAFSQETTREDWGEDWEAYEQAHQRVQDERKVQKAGLIWQG
jgi:hypothetical protein